MAPIVPPFTAETAQQKVKVAQDLWNTRDPERVVLAYTVRTSLPDPYVPPCARDECLALMLGCSPTRSGGTATAS